MLPKLRILVVDDNKTDRLIVRAMVSKLKPNLVHEGENGAVAEAKLTTAVEVGKPYNLIILDWNMPGINGLKVLQLIRSNAPLKATAVIVMTASADRQVVQAAIQNGADDFIVKPIDEKLLLQKIGKLFN